MLYRLEKLTIRDTFKQWRDKINVMTDKMNRAITADDEGVVTIGPEECNAVKLIVKVPSYFESTVNFKETENEGSYISSITSATIPGTVNAGLVLTGNSDTGDYIPWISGKTANGHITQYTTKNNDNLYFSFIDDNGAEKELFRWDNELNRIEGTISHAVTSDYAKKVKTVDAENANKNYKIFFGQSEDGFADMYEDASDITYNPRTNTLKTSTFEGYLNGLALRAEDANNADKLKNTVTISLSNHVIGETSFNGSQSVDIPVTIPNTGVVAGSYGHSANANLDYGDTFTVPYYTVNERGQITSSKNSTLKLPALIPDELVVQNHSTLNNQFPILAVTTANASASLGPQQSLFNKDIKINPSTGTIHAKNGNFTNTLTANEINATTVIKINGKTVPTDENTVHKTETESISGVKTFEATSGNTITYWDNSTKTHKIGMRVNSDNNAGLYDFTNNKWIIQILPDGTTVVKAKSDTADRLATARKLGVNLDKTFTTADNNTATFDGSQNQLEIPVKGTLDIANGGTNATTAAGAIANFGITATIAELNYVHGVTSNIQTQLNAKAPEASPAFTGTPTAPSVTNLSDSSDKIATTKFVNDAIDEKVSQAIAANDAMSFKGTIGTNGTVTELPTTHKKGWTYKVATAGTYAGKTCEVGDMIICVTNGTTANNNHWTVVQGNIDNAVNNLSSTHVNGGVAIYNGTTGNSIKDSGFTIGKSVPADAVFTDTTYPEGTLAQLKTGTDTVARVWTAKIIHDYVQIPASTSALGVVKIGTNIDVTTAGVISVKTATTTQKGILQVTNGNGLKLASGVLTMDFAGTGQFGTVKIGSNISVSTAGVISLTKANVVAALGYTPPTADNNTWIAMKGATSTANGAVGYINAVPPSDGYNTKYWRADGKWVVPPDTKYTHPTTAGNKHVPAGGASGQTLIWSAAGTAAWGRKVTMSASAASGGANGDIWYQYV